MRGFLPTALMLSALVLQGCSGSPTRTDSELSSLQLFGSGDQPRFTVDLACAGLTSTDDVQCPTVQNAFYAWSENRHVRLRIVSKNDPVFQPKVATASLQSAPVAEPYLVTIHVQPLIEPSFRVAGSGVPGYANSGHPGSVGYRAWIQVFSTTTGALIHKLSLHHQQAMPDHANVTPVFKMEVYRVIRSIDPAYPG